MAPPVNRRSFFGGIVAQALGASIVVTEDPIWGAIDGAAEAYVALDQALGRQEELEREVAGALARLRRGRSSRDPRWVALQPRNWKLSMKRRRGQRAP